MRPRRSHAVCPRMRCDRAVTSAVRGGVPERPGIPNVPKTQLLGPNWPELNWEPSGSNPVSATKRMADSLFISGGALVIAGAFLIAPPAGFIVGGLFLVVCGVGLARGRLPRK